MLLQIRLFIYLLYLFLLLDASSRRPFSPVEVIYRGWRRMEDRAGGVCRSCLPHSPGAATTVYLRCVEKAIGDAWKTAVLAVKRSPSEAFTYLPTSETN